MARTSEVDQDEEQARSTLLESNSSNNGATSMQTLMNIIVSIVGTGVLGLPYAFRTAGWLAGSLGVITAALLSYYCMLLLVQCKRRAIVVLEGGGEENRIETYGDLGARAFGAKGRFLTELMIVISQLGGTIVFLLFIGENLSSVFSGRHRISPSVFILILLPLQIALSFITSLKVLAPFSALADACNVLAMAFVIKEDVKQLQSFGGSRIAFNGVWSLPFACGVAVYCFDGFALTLSLEKSMARPKKFPWVLLQAFIGVCIVYTCFGVLGYLAFGDNTMDIITLNLPNSLSSIIVKLGVSMALALTFPMSMHPIKEIMEAKLKSRKSITLRAARVIMVVAVAVLATAAPDFSVLISFIGSTLCALLSFILPALYHLKLVNNLSVWERVLDYIIFVIGIVFAACGTCAAITGHFKN
ncbi:Amino acid transporters domain-containing protein [Dioscorea alata]|uniref:Amino acid transporters domain-containing protein n=1 Tax=Dioscorea alata TaxID=55571 RepID=A0ACB7WNA6_DIOAL|nr:Amino acid transporters domain-containing protein [Dioscorea alata]